MTDGRKRASGLEAADIGSGLRPKNIGACVKRVEDPRLLTGQGAFTADRLVPGAMHVAFRRSDHAHAIISSINTSAAAEMPGVFAIYTAQEPDDLVKPVRASSRMENYHATTLYPLAREKVRYVGEPVVVVLAENRYLAEDARDRIEIAYEALAIVIDPEIAVRADAPLLHVEAGTNVLAMREFARGDIGAEMTAAPMRVGGRFRFHRKTPIAIENRACLAEYDRGRRSLTLTLSTQIPGIIRDLLADLLDMPGHSVRVVAADVGGGFGGKASLYQEEIVVSVLARHLGRAVRWTGDRLEDLTSTSHGFDEIVDAELGLDRDGRIFALAAEVIGDVGAYSIYPWTAALEPVQVVSFMPGPYRVPTYRGHVRAVTTCKVPTGPYRGVGRPISTFVMERFHGKPDERVRGDWLRTAPGGADESPCRGTAGRHRHCHLRGTDGDRVAHLGGAGHADQHRHGISHHPPRPHRGADRQLRDCLTWPRARDHARAGDCRRTRDPDRRYQDPAWGQRRRCARHRDLCKPQRSLGWRSGHAGGAAAQGKSDSSGLAPARSVGRGHRSCGRTGIRCRHRPLPDVPRDREGRLFRNGSLAEERARGIGGHQGLRPVFRHNHLGNAYRGAGD